MEDKLTLDKSLSLFLCADATLEKYFCVRQREKGAPFLIPTRASLAHSATIYRNIGNQVLRKNRTKKGIKKEINYSTTQLTSISSYDTPTQDSIFWGLKCNFFENKKGQSGTLQVF